MVEYGFICCAFIWLVLIPWCIFVAVLHRDEKKADRAFKILQILLLLWVRKAGANAIAMLNQQEEAPATSASDDNE